jgi:hypothetical protein
MHRWVRLTLALIVLLLLFPLSGCGRKQYVSFTYNFAISPPKGEVLRNVTVYLPFPASNGKPIWGIYRGLKRDYAKYRAMDYPDAELGLIKTKHGSLLKVYIPVIDQRGYGLDGAFGFEEPYSQDSMGPRFPLNPRLVPRKLADYRNGYLCDSYIYAKFQGARALGYALDYKVRAEKPSILPLDYVPQDSYSAYLGWFQPPRHAGSLVKYIKMQGWNKIPLSDIGYREEQ